MSHLPVGAVAKEPEEESRIYVASQWKLAWWKFRKHRVAMVSGVVVILFYLVALFAEFLTPMEPHDTHAKYLFAPPQALRLVDEQGAFGLFVYGYTTEIDSEALRRTFVINPDDKIPVGLFVEGYPYKVLGLFDSNRHLIGPKDPDQLVYFWGADRMGRDSLSRLIIGTRISMSIGLIGVTISLVLGVFLGGISGYYGGIVDNIIQRSIEILRSIPAIPLWMALAAAMPVGFSPLQVYLGIVIILSLLGWTSMARVVRGRFMAMREEDFVMAARLDGQGELNIIFRQMLPAFTSHIIAAVTLTIPGMILAETALSFLGLGLREPAISWGVLLQSAQQIGVIANAPWLLAPAVAIVVVVLALNFLGDGLRDAADPYAR
jgi:peptide/nickel transport system permease protein